MCPTRPAGKAANLMARNAGRRALTVAGYVSPILFDGLRGNEGGLSCRHIGDAIEPSGRWNNTRLVQPTDTDPIPAVARQTLTC